MSIAALMGRGKALAEAVPRDALLLGVALLASLASFGFGYLEGRDEAVGQGGAISFEVTSQDEVAARDADREDAGNGTQTVAASVAGADPPAEAPAKAGEGVYVASKNGTKYYLPTCSGAKRIKDENKVWFNTVAAAVAEGYTPATNCKGL